LMSEFAETAFGPAAEAQFRRPALTESLLENAVQLRSAMDTFLSRPAMSSPETEHIEHRPQAEEPAPVRRRVAHARTPWQAQFLEWLTLLAGTCRSQRHPLSVVMLAISDDTPQVDDSEGIISQWLDDSCGLELPS